MTRRGHRRRAALDPKHRAALVDFGRAYLHEDMLVEYGSAANAAQAFAADATADERRLVAEALDRIAEIHGAQSITALATAFSSDLRCAWTPASVADVQALAETIRKRD